MFQSSTPVSFANLRNRATSPDSDIEFNSADSTVSIEENETIRSAIIPYSNMAFPGPSQLQNSTLNNTNTPNEESFTLLCVEVLTKNSLVLKSPTLNTTDAPEILKQVFGLSLSHVKGVATIKAQNRGIGFNFWLKQAVRFNPARFQEFSFVIEGATFTGRLLLNTGVAPSLGETVQVSVVRTGFHITEEQIASWLSVYGTVEGNLKFRDNPDLPGVWEDSVDVFMKLRKHIPSILPAFGKKLNIRYKGQPIMCSKCMIHGHIRKECTSSTNNWMGYVKMFVDSGTIHPSMFGNWYEYLQDHQSVLASQN